MAKRNNEKQAEANAQRPDGRRVKEKWYEAALMFVPRKVAGLPSYYKRKPVNAAINTIVLPTLGFFSFGTPFGGGGLVMYGTLKYIQNHFLTKDPETGRRRNRGIMGIVGPVVALSFGYNMSGCSDSGQHHKARSEIVRTIEKGLQSNDPQVIEVPYHYVSGLPWNDKYEKNGNITGTITDWHGQSTLSVANENWLTIQYTDDLDPKYKVEKKYHVTVEGKPPEGFQSEPKPPGYDDAENRTWATPSP